MHGRVRLSSDTPVSKIPWKQTSLGVYGTMRLCPGTGAAGPGQRPEFLNVETGTQLVLQRHVRQLSIAQVIIFQELKSFLRISIRTWLMDQNPCETSHFLAIGVVTQRRSTSVRREKVLGLQWVQFPPGNWVAPAGAGSYRFSGGGNETVGAFETRLSSGNTILNFSELGMVSPELPHVPGTAPSKCYSVTSFFPSPVTSSAR